MPGSTRTHNSRQFDRGAIPRFFFASTQALGLNLDLALTFTFWRLEEEVSGSDYGVGTGAANVSPQAPPKYTVLVGFSFTPLSKFPSPTPSYLLLPSKEKKIRES